MSEPDHEAAIIRRVYTESGYSHAENIRYRLAELEAEHGTEKAIRILHEEVLE